jgi:hypothetical protein
MNLLCPINQSFHTGWCEKLSQNIAQVSRAFSRRAKIIIRRHKHPTMAEEIEADDDSRNNLLEQETIINNSSSKILEVASKKHSVMYTSDSILKILSGAT